MNREGQEIRARNNTAYVTSENVELLRRPSHLDERLTKAQKLDIRAHQRTYQGAYIRTCIGCLSFSLLVMKLFSKEFMSIGLVFQIYSLLICVIGYNRASNMDLYFTDFSKGDWYKDFMSKDGNIRDTDTINGHILVDNKYYFKTSGNYVVWLSLITLSCYIVLFILLAIM
ncbi:hypothetical protein C6P40_000449 [Pichia californica]|uniref:Uncharacterized protein n=1 Tax=Pichia californica TaxID=460514 RepID=A0A9P6WPN3_9ASCO|nr:hypothetical protein C6P42_001841 [[Candida] californica]KAG0690951.1 hypothetical protein C6P40_000449 [[Candida] californica]